MILQATLNFRQTVDTACLILQTLTFTFNLTQSVAFF